MFASKFPSLRCGISAVYLSVLRVMKGLTTGVRASLRHLLPLPQQRRVICEIRVSRSTNRRAFRTSFRKIPFRTFAFRRLPIAHARPQVLCDWRRHKIPRYTGITVFIQTVYYRRASLLCICIACKDVASTISGTNYSPWYWHNA